MGLSAAYTSFDLGPSIASGCSINWLCGPYLHFILAPVGGSPKASHPLLNVIGHSRCPWVPCFSPWLPWPSGFHFLFYHSLNDGTATFLHGFPWNFYLCGSPGPIKRASSSKLNISCPVIGKPLISGVPAEDKYGLPWRQDHTFSYLVFQPGLLEYVGDQTSSPHMGLWGLITSSISQHYSYLNTIAPSVLRGRWVVSLMLRGYQPLWWWLTSSPKPKRHFRESIRVQKQLFPRSNLFYRVSYLITLLPILWWWKGGGTFCEFVAPLFVVWHFPIPW